ncbi:hypothetical protein BUALT_Bualt04G0146700 [Buddleja alternifolia]|uniref:BHLH domain-containing protein n=1 Tax=Buddleja alternifolia TaxID=168488 RepID=A0AAV6XNX9_9LAMI|nr:hypothetical protein BUALT_Bualt04G0146700 [Buddleja alternifolia]
MGSETVDPVSISTRSCPSRKKGKVPRKIHKAEREKLKRDHMNDLFVNLEKTLDLDQPNNGKASLLRDTIKLLGELLSQVDNLKKENVTLLSESNYVTIEKNELVEETSALDAQIKRLQREIDERANVTLPQSNPTAQVPEDHVAFPLVGHAPESTSVVGPVFVLPLHHESQVCPSAYPDVNITKVPSSVSRPRPRYPSSSDSWPSHLLTK